MTIDQLRSLHGQKQIVDIFVIRDPVEPSQWLVGFVLSGQDTAEELQDQHGDDWLFSSLDDALACVESVIGQVSSIQFHHGL